jgi:hypothetical protein
MFLFCHKNSDNGRKKEYIRKKQDEKKREKKTRMNKQMNEKKRTKERDINVVHFTPSPLIYPSLRDRSSIYSTT